MAGSALRQYEAYAAYASPTEMSGTAASSSILQVTDTYLHGQLFYSRFKKHASRLWLGFYYAIIAAMVFLLLQAANTLISGLYKIGILGNSQQVVQRVLVKTQKEHQMLENKIQLFSSSDGIENLARNNLEMVGPNEVLIRVR